MSFHLYMVLCCSLLDVCRLPKELICDQVQTFFRSASQSTSAPSLSLSPENTLGGGRRLSRKRLCDQVETLFGQSALLVKWNPSHTWLFDIISQLYMVSLVIQKDTMSFWPDDLETRQGLFTLFEAGEYLVESFCPLCLEFKDLVILVSSSALSKQAEALHLWSLTFIF